LNRAFENVRTRLIQRHVHDARDDATRITNHGVAMVVTPLQLRSTTMANTVEMHVVATDEAPDQTIGEQIRFQLDFMVLMLNIGRTKEATEAYSKLLNLIEDLDEYVHIDTINDDHVHINSIY
jgi:hypothetical protein